MASSYVQLIQLSDDTPIGEHTKGPMETYRLLDNTGPEPITIPLTPSDSRSDEALYEVYKTLRTPEEKKRFLDQLPDQDFYYFNEYLDRHAIPEVREVNVHRASPHAYERIDQFQSNLEEWSFYSQEKERRRLQNAGMKQDCCHKCCVLL